MVIANKTCIYYVYVALCRRRYPATRDARTEFSSRVRRQLRTVPLNLKFRAVLEKKKIDLQNHATGCVKRTKRLSNVMLKATEMKTGIRDALYRR